MSKTVRLLVLYACAMAMGSSLLQSADASSNETPTRNFDFVRVNECAFHRANCNKHHGYHDGYHHDGYHDGYQPHHDGHNQHCNKPSFCKPDCDDRKEYATDRVARERGWCTYNKDRDFSCKPSCEPKACKPECRPSCKPACKPACQQQPACPQPCEQEPEWPRFKPMHRPAQQQTLCHYRESLEVVIAEHCIRNYHLIAASPLCLITGQQQTPAHQDITNDTWRLWYLNPCGSLEELASVTNGTIEVVVKKEAGVVVIVAYLISYGSIVPKVFYVSDLGILPLGCHEENPIAVDVLGFQACGADFLSVTWTFADLVDGKHKKVAELYHVSFDRSGALSLVKLVGHGTQYHARSVHVVGVYEHKCHFVKVTLNHTAHHGAHHGSGCSTVLWYRVGQNGCLSQVCGPQ